MSAIPSGLFYASEEDVRVALDIEHTARARAEIRKALASATLSVEGQLHRRFYPEISTRYFDWPTRQFSPSWILRLDADEVIEVNTLTAGSTVIPSSAYNLEPANSGPPYTRIEVKLSSPSTFAAADTHQRAIEIIGLFGHSADEIDAGTITANISSTSATTCNISDSSLIGVGNVIRMGDERMIVQNKSMLDTGQNSSALTAAVNDQAITGVSAGTVAADEVILVDAERMLVVDVAGTTLIVQRAYDGTTLAAHLNGADIYALRTLTVTRGALGTTAATHSSSTAVARHVVPALAHELCTAEAINWLEQKRSALARTVGSGENERESSGRGLRQIRDDAYTALGRKARKRVV